MDTTERRKQDEAVGEDEDAARLFAPLLSNAATITNGGAGGVVVGALLATHADGRIGFVTFPGQAGTAALSARTIVDLPSTAIGGQVLLLFENADPARPIVIGVLKDAGPRRLRAEPDFVEVDVNDERLIVSAKRQLVLRCGSASIILTEEGKVLIQGTHVSSRSSGVNRIKGGSVQIN